MVSKALKFLTSLREERPDLASALDELCVLYEGKLWHQLSLKLENVVDDAGFQIGDTLISLYRHFVSEFGGKLNPLKFVQFAVRVSERIDNIDERMEFLVDVQDHLKQESHVTRLTALIEPSLYVQMALLQDKLIKGETEQCKRALSEAKETLESLSNVRALIEGGWDENGKPRWIQLSVQRSIMPTVNCIV